MKISILDQAPIAANQTAQDALYASMELAKVGEASGYTRYWIAEHHDLSGLACSVPEVMLGYIGAHTNHIRIGSGAVLLPHYKLYKVAETYNMLATLFPGRIDIGIGRAPGASAEATNALSDNFLKQVREMPNLLKDLLFFLDDDFPSDHVYMKVSASPLPNISPIAWLLGTSKKSALLAAENGMNYTFGQFMSDNDMGAIVQQYRDNFKPRKQEQVPKVIIAVAVICAETMELAEEIALSSIIWQLQMDKGLGQQGVPSIEEAKSYPLSDKEKESFKKIKQRMVIGNPLQVKQKLIAFEADEIMIITITYSPSDRIRSYELIAEEVFSNK